MMGVQSIIEKHCFSIGVEVSKFNMFDRESPIPIESMNHLKSGRSNIIHVASACDNILYLNCNGEDIPATPFSDLYFSMGPSLKNILVKSYIRYKPIAVIEKKDAGKNQYYPYPSGKTPAVSDPISIKWDCVTDLLGSTVFNGQYLGNDALNLVTKKEANQGVYNEIQQETSEKSFWAAEIHKEYQLNEFYEIQEPKKTRRQERIKGLEKDTPF
jgi:hypothetical protein